MSASAGVDALVKEYLISRGYSKAAAQLEEESSAREPGIPNELVPKQLLSTIAEDLYVLGMRDKNATSYFTAYDLLRSWAVNSIDMVKNQLLSATFPIFVHRLGSRFWCTVTWSPSPLHCLYTIQLSWFGASGLSR